jgi:hypothetical protein
VGVIIYLETLWIDNPTGSFTSAFGMYLIRMLLHNYVRRFPFDLSHRLEYGMVAANTHWQSSKIFLTIAQIILRLKYDIPVFIRYIMYAFDGCTLNLQIGKA